eukprot:10902921-Alexandrium_andersonii.AAC.1
MSQKELHRELQVRTNAEGAPGPARFKLRTLEAAMLRAPRGGLRIEADWRAGGPCADRGLHFGHLAR